MKKLVGRTYSLPEDSEYYVYIAEQVDKLSAEIGGLGSLDKLLSELVAKDSAVEGKYEQFETIFAHITARMTAAYTPHVAEFLASLSPQHPEYKTFGISARGYHLRMLHLEVLNRLMRKNFIKAEHKVLLLPHCLRDFRANECRFQPGDVDYICLGCTRECQINQSRMFLEDYPKCHLYVSQTQDLERVFELAQQCYKDIAMLGVACIPELYEGMSLSRKMGIPAQGVLLNYNRCSRWMGTAHRTNFSLEQLKKIIDPAY